MSETIITSNTSDDNSSIIKIPSFLLSSEPEVMPLATCTTLYQTCGSCQIDTQCGTCQHTGQCTLCVEVQCTSCVWSCNSTECSSCENSCLSCNVLCNSCMEDMCGSCQWSGCQSCEGCLTCEDCQGSCESCVSCETCQSCQSTQCTSCMTQQSCNGTCQTTMSCIECELSQCIPCEAAQTCTVGCMLDEGCLISQGCSDVALESAICSQGAGLGGGVSGNSPVDGGSFYVTITGLQYPFNTTYYRDVVVTKVNYGKSTSSISNYLVKQNATSKGTINSVTVPVKNAGIGTYIIYAYAYTNQYYLAGTWEVTVLDKVEKWVWSTEVRNAFLNKGRTNNLRFGEWNLFVEKVKEALLFKNLGVTTISPNIAYSYNLMPQTSTITITTLLNESKASYKGEQMTAKQFNSLRYGIDLLNRTEISTVYKDYNVYGSYFLTLETKLNSIL